MKRMATIAVALAFVALVFQGGGVSACQSSSVDASVCVSISDGNATFVVTYDPSAEINGAIRLVPKPMVFTENTEAGTWETGEMDARLIIAGNSEVAILIPEGHGLYRDATIVRLQGPLEFQCDPLTPGTAALGPVPLVSSDVEDPYGGNGPVIIVIEPWIEDDVY